MSRAKSKMKRRVKRKRWMSKTLLLGTKMRLKITKMMKC